jgi:hypothetical protein
VPIIIPTSGRFNLKELVDYVNLSGRNYIIQGQQSVKLADHTKPKSLDYWLRKNVTPLQQDTKRAENDLMLELVATGFFEEKDGLICPDSDEPCKGLMLVPQAFRD